MYKKGIINHYIENWKQEPVFHTWDAGPIDKLPSDFLILEFSPNKTRNMWTYATCCMSQPEDKFPIELHIFSTKQDDTIVELLTTLAYYHRNTQRVGLNHTVFFGRGWQDQSLCDHGLISLPYLDGQELEEFHFNGTEIKFYWLIPITKEEVTYKINYGIEALESKFDFGLNYLDPKRKSLV